MLQKKVGKRVGRMGGVEEIEKERGEKGKLVYFFFFFHHSPNPSGISN